MSYTILTLGTKEELVLCLTNKHFILSTRKLTTFKKARWNSYFVMKKVNSEPNEKFYVYRRVDDNYFILSCKTDQKKFITRNCAVIRSYFKRRASAAVASSFNPHILGLIKRNVASGNMHRSAKMLGDSENVVSYSLYSYISQLKECKSLKISITFEIRKICINC